MKKLFSKTLLCSVILASSFGGAMHAHAQTPHGIAAVVNDDVITTYDLRQRALFMMATQGIQPTEETQARILQQAMKNLIDEKLQIQESNKYDQTISDEAVQFGVQELISRNGISVNEFANRLAQAGISISTLNDQVRSEIAWQRIISGLYGSRIRISDAQIDETINRVSASAGKPSYRVAEIYIESSPDIGGINGAMQGAEAMIKQLNEGAPFQTLAQQFSSSPSAAKGGDMGWVHEGELREELDTAIVQMEKGQVSPPITVPGGVYVLALMDKQISTAETFYTLKQLAYAYSDESKLPAARTAMKAATAAFTSCDTIAADVSGIGGIANNNMGEIKAGDVNNEILELLSNTNVGAVSEPMETPGGLISLVVCDRKLKGSDIPTRDQVEDRLLSQQEAQASKRHLRNLRRNATIVTR
ncbi:MAG: peptidylprolyl isomerase [Rhodobacteraceae bacterium]|nr:peptidylprolyl isomerase [Paracoccaceae bacterium]